MELFTAKQSWSWSRSRSRHLDKPEPVINGTAPQHWLWRRHYIYTSGVVMQVQATTDPPAGHRGPAQAGHSQWGDRQDAASRQVHL